MSEVVGEVWVDVRPLTTGFGPALARDVSGSAQAAGARAGREAGQSFSSSFRDTLKTGAAVVGIVGAFETVRASISDAAAHAGEVALLDKAIQNVDASQTIAGQSLEDLIRHQALERGFIDEDLYPAYTRLVGATRDSQKAYRDLGLAEDIARQRHIGVTVAALALGKAEQGSVTSLQRLGIILPQNVRDLKGVEKATAAVAIVQDRFAGSADRFAASGAGALARFGEARHVIEESIGAALLPEIEHAAAATADWASKSENLARVERDVADAAHVVEGGVKAAAVGFEVVDHAVGPVVSLLGGFDHAAELAFGALALRKVQVWGTAAVTALTGAAGAEAAHAAAVTADTAAVTANTVAQGANVLAVDAATASFGLSAAAATRGGVVLGSASTEAAAARTGFLSLGVSGTGLAGVLKSGVAPAVVLAGYELSTLIRKFPHWESSFESLGAKAEGLAEKLGLVSKGAANTQLAGATISGLHSADVQKQLAAAFQTAQTETKGISDDKFRRELEDKIVAKLVGPGFTFHDAQIFAQTAVRRANDFTSADARRGAPSAVPPPGRPTDVDYQISLQNALATKTTADERALYEDRKRYIDKRITALKADNSLTADEKKSLLRLETERNSLESAITGIDKQAAQDAKAAADKARQAYSDAVGLRDQALQLQAQRAQLTTDTQTDDLKAARAQLAFDRREAVDAKLTAQQRAQYASQVVGAEQTILTINQQIHQKEAQAYRDQLSLREQRLQLAATRAQLTDKTIKDDQAADRALIRFYQREAHDKKLTEAERLQYQSLAVQEQVTLKGLTQQAQGATAQQFFAEAASELRSFGSNIAARNGVLSGQDARAAFASHALGMRGAVDVAANAQAQRDSAALSELQKQTNLLADIARAVGGGRKTNVPLDPRSADARRVANLVGR